MVGRGMVQREMLPQRGMVGIRRKRIVPVGLITDGSVLCYVAPAG